MVDRLSFPSAPAAPSPPVPPAPAPAPSNRIWDQAAREDARLAAALDQIRRLLVAGETPWAYTVQRRLFALTHRRMVVMATSGRLLVLTRPLLGGYRLSDVRWQDLHDVATEAGIFGADLTLRALAQPDMPSQSSASMLWVLKGLRKDLTAEVYRLAQGQEQSWREKRRARELEETRARSGGIQLGGSEWGRSNASQGGSPQDRLAHAKGLLDQGLISDSEYETVKANILRDL